ncbi:peptidoglycan-binding protein [Streptomyces sp. NBC_01198]|uniref:peptidoglycan-binding protein n=1 Tax=Streptomyces sp. NBC_01198 TaxID=2903769 RepID=UPI002E1517EE|nr:peptidoglycan-binding protein [Streptomyces sp. NBC_01198]
MARGGKLPPDLDPRVRQLIGQLRRLKEAGDLSLSQVAARTGYSKASWERYLSGRNLPPQQAVEAFARALGLDPARLLALHEVAAEVWTRPGDARVREAAATDAEAVGSSSAGAAPPSPAGAVESPPLLRRRPLQIAAGALVLAAAAVLLAVRPWQDDHRSTATSYTCHITRSDSTWYAGLSRSRTAVVQEGMVGKDVAEVQCLLKRAGFSPGEIDGIYGELTQRAVRRLQTEHALVVDGMVGPHTWKALRG